MSTVAQTRDEEMLARLAELDLAAAEKVHGKLMAADDAAEIADLSRAYQRLSRSVRQTLALKSRLARDHAQHQAWLEGRTREPPSLDLPLVEQLTGIDTRVAEVLDAVGRVVHAVHGESRGAAEALDRFDRELDDWVDEEDFLDVDFDTLVVRAARVLGLPEDLAQAWSILKRPPNAPDPVGRCAAPPPDVTFAAEPPSGLRRESG